MVKTKSLYLYNFLSVRLSHPAALSKQCTVG